MARKRGRPVNLEHRDQRREEILDVAEKLFARHGYAETDTQMLADALRVGKGTIYRYYPSKARLFHAIVNRGMEQLRQRVESDVSPVIDPLERIQQAISSFLLHFENHPQLAELFVQELACFKKGNKPAYFAHHDMHIGPWRELYRQMIAQGRVRSQLDHPEHDVVNDLLFGTIIANHALGRRGSARQQAKRIIDIVFHGIVTDAERSRANNVNQPQTVNAAEQRRKKNS
ncbi:MAG TPA: TetR/AcrR family transcriptional regulator [Gemmatales bacterium]|nr:TetR/AcrR family transcriptional regulator [Gemmatales bacterium]